MRSATATRLGCANRKTPPALDGSRSARLRLVDLFAGCGGLSFGLVEAARRLELGAEVGLAVEHDPEALAVFERNIPNDPRELGIELSGCSTERSRRRRRSRSAGSPVSSVRLTFSWAGRRVRATPISTTRRGATIRGTACMRGWHAQRKCSSQQAPRDRERPERPP